MNKSPIPKIGEIWKYDWLSENEYERISPRYIHYLVLEDIDSYNYRTYNIDFGVEDVMSWEEEFMEQWEKVSNAPRRIKNNRNN